MDHGKSLEGGLSEATGIDAAGTTTIRRIAVCNKRLC